jgi:hypothetical protein
MAFKFEDAHPGYFGQLIKNYRNNPHFGATYFFHGLIFAIFFDTKWVWAVFWATFSKTHLFTLLVITNTGEVCATKVSRFSFRVARWHIFKPKLLIWVNFGWYCNGSILYGHSVYFTAILYILWPFGILYVCVILCIFRVLECCTKKNLATLFLLKKENGM